MQTVRGQWKEAGEKYQLTLAGDSVASVDGDRLTMTAEGTELVFSREDLKLPRPK